MSEPEPGREGGTLNGAPTYYDRPVVKEPVWIWSVPAYFLVGGASGAAAALGAAAAVTGRPELRGLVRRCRRLAAAGTTVGTGLLVIDLGRPERFLNMLRVFRPTSPMSVGSWVLAASAGTSAMAAAFDGRSGPAGRLAGAAGAGAGILGGPLAAYTAVLVTSTAIPVWSETRRSLPPLFVASAAAGAADVLELGDLNADAERVVRRFGTAGKLAELGAALAVEREASRVERVGRALREGLPGTLWQAGKTLNVASLLLGLGRPRSARRRLAASLGLAGALATRFAVFHAGRASARDPRATFEGQAVRNRGADG